MGFDIHSTHVIQGAGTENPRCVVCGAIGKYAPQDLAKECQREQEKIW